MPVVASKSGKDHREVVLPMSVLFECCALTREREGLKMIYGSQAWQDGMSCNVKVRVVNATTLEVTRGRLKVESSDASTRAEILDMQGPSLKVTPHIEDKDT